MDQYDNEGIITQNGDGNLSNRAKILLPICFIVAGIFMTFVLPRFCRWKTSRQRLETNAVTTEESTENLSEKEIEQALVTKYVLQHSLASVFHDKVHSDHLWWKRLFKCNQSHNNGDLCRTKNIDSRSDSTSVDIDKSTSSSSLSCSNTEEALVCQICIEPYKIGDKVAIPKQKNSSCNHIFHHKCISAWLKRNNSCPCCRVTYINIEEVIESEKKTPIEFFRSWNNENNGDFDHIISSQFSQTRGLIFHPTHCLYKCDVDDEKEETKTISIRSTNDFLYSNNV